MKQHPLTPHDYEQAKEYGLTDIAALNPFLLEYEAGEYICQEECHLPYLLLVRHGSAKVLSTLENGKRLLNYFYAAGSVIGDLEFLMERDTAVSSVQAITPFTCLAILIAPNRTALYQNNAFLRTLCKDMAGKFERTTKNCAHIILYPLEVRLCSYIDTGCKQDLFHEKLTEVAEVLGTSYRHLIRALNSLIDDGILKKENHVYHIIDRKELNARSKDFYKPVEGHMK